MKLSLPAGLALSALGVATCGALLSRLPGILSLDEAIGLPALFAAVGRPAAPDEVAVIAISRETAETLGVSDELDEWPRSVHGRLIDRLVAAGVSAIVFDVSFAELRDAAEDAELAEAIGRAGNVILLERTRPPSAALAARARQAGISVELREPPAPIFKTGALGSAPFTLPTVPIRLNQFWIFDRSGSHAPNLPAIALQAYANKEYEQFLTLVEAAYPALSASIPRDLVAVRKAGGLEIASQALRDEFVVNDELGERLIKSLQASERLEAEARARLLALASMYAARESAYLRYYGPARTIDTIAYEDVLSDRTYGAAAGLLEGRVAFVGIAETSQPEQQDTFYSIYSETSGQNLSGVEIGATAFGNMLHRQLIAPLPMWPQLMLVFLWGILVASTTRFLALRHTIGILVALSAIYALSAVLIFQFGRVFVPTFVPLLIQVPCALILGLLWHRSFESRRKEHLRETLEAYVPTAGIVAGAADGGFARDNAQQLIDGVCLVSDVRDYTALAERLNPAVLGALMNEYYELMFSIVERHGGLVTDTAGDSMIAVWGGEWKRNNPCTDAAAAAHEMMDALEVFNQDHRETALVTGLGLHRGEIMMANIGSATRFNYRAVGDTVNTAARIQALTRVVGAATLASADSIEIQESAWRKIGRFRLAGKSAALDILELCMSDRRTLEPGLELFSKGQIDEARQWFSEQSRHDASDTVMAFYETYCASLQIATREWEGVVNVTAK